MKAAIKSRVALIILAIVILSLVPTQLNCPPGIPSHFFTVHFSFPQGAPPLNQTAEMRCDILKSKKQNKDVIFVLQLPEGLEFVSGDLLEWESTSLANSNQVEPGIPIDLTHNEAPGFVTGSKKWSDLYPGVKNYYSIIHSEDWNAIGGADKYLEANFGITVKSVGTGDWRIICSVYDDISGIDYTYFLYMLISDNAAVYGEGPLFDETSLYTNDQKMFPFECIPVLSNAPGLNQTATLTYLITPIPGVENSFVKSLNIDLIFPEVTGIDLVSGDPSLQIDAPNDNLDIEWVIKATKTGVYHVGIETAFFSKEMTIKIGGKEFPIKSKLISDQGAYIRFAVNETSGEILSQGLPIYRNKQ